MCLNTTGGNSKCGSCKLAHLCKRRQKLEAAVVEPQAGFQLRSMNNEFLTLASNHKLITMQRREVENVFS